MHLGQLESKWYDPTKPDMRTNRILIWNILATGLLIGCFPNFQATTIQRESITKNAIMHSPSKAYLIDASVVLFPKGFVVRGDSVIGTGSRFWIHRSDAQDHLRLIPIDSIISITAYEPEVSPGRGFAGLLLGVTGAITTPLLIYTILIIISPGVGD